MSNVLAREQQIEKQFDWPVCYKAEELLLNRCGEFLQQTSFARELAQRMREHTGTLFLDWVDYIGFPGSAEAELRHAGFIDDPEAETVERGPVLHHPEALLPRL